MVTAKTSLPVFSGICLLLSACSSETNLQHVPFCQALTANLLGSPRDIAWQDTRKEMHGYDDLKVNLTFHAPGKEDMRAVCFYEYTAPDETALTLANPLSGYATSPYKMTLNGRPVPNQDLVNAMNHVMRDTGKKIVEDSKKAVQETARQVKERIQQGQ